ncbi:MAG: P-II family nitrogen regulator [Planctomycetes bacterium]|nr:P-II family nitrogen regulator [Planctomycetota bacterium]
MKVIIAVIKPFKLNACLKSLADAGFADISHSEARGYGRQKDHLRDYKDDSYAVAFLPKIRLELTVQPADAKKAIEAITKICRTGRQGDGKIWVLAAKAPIRQGAGV